MELAENFKFFGWSSEMLRRGSLSDIYTLFYVNEQIMKCK